MISPVSPLVLVGAGNMGGAMLNGWLDAGTDPAAIVVIDPKPSEAMAARLASAGCSLRKRRTGGDDSRYPYAGGQATDHGSSG